MGGPAALLGDQASCVPPRRSHPFLRLSDSLLPRAGFIRGLLENVGAEIDPIRLIRRIQNGLEIPGLKPALIKILQDFNLQARPISLRTFPLVQPSTLTDPRHGSLAQISLMEGCKSILYSDCRTLALSLQGSQTSGFLWTGACFPLGLLTSRRP